MPSTSVTSLPLPYDIGTELVAEILGVEANATTYLLNCAPGPDTSDCGVDDRYVTVGSWASKTIPPGAAKTGLYDEYYKDPEYEFSVHCEMSKTTAQECTTINIGGNDKGHPTSTLAHEDFKYVNLDYFIDVPVTITAGVELLAAAKTASQEATATDDTSGSSQSTAGTATPVEASESDTSATESSNGTPSPESTSGAASCLARIFTTIAVASFVMTLAMS
ncbi:hypothetical protein NM208_g4638 [Fusarium decemcellulare]|uniref:Uncharacterized protein n=1 Tax=Fusarium decemcellulare TaxID=57161 RepID=A0ACC1SJZ0_9HYPO|nr:hypothetical protein NM208_g4638 [Fusarium decemcellulare]